MRGTSHPNFILGVISFIVLFIGIGLRSNGYRSGDYIIMASVAMGAIHWIWSIVDVFNHQNFASQSKKFWIILVIAIPAIGSFCYYIMGSKTVKL
jgi:hypothetical protein